MKVVILCGGRGVIDPESRLRIPKALMQVGGRPLVSHVMNSFATAGFTEFVLALGEGGDAIRRHFYYQHIEGRDIEFSGGSGQFSYLTNAPEDNWQITCVDTGINAQTGCRVARCRRYVEREPFFVTYSDCLCNVNLQALIAFHRTNGSLLTATGVQPTTRFGTFAMESDVVTGYSLETHVAGMGGYVNGGYMVMDPDIFEHLDVFNECTLEREVFTKLARLGLIGVFPHTGYWQAVDTERDLATVTKFYLGNQRPWLSDEVRQA